ncbi:MAG: DoxX family membrane protein [Chthoniobacterales bacterium]|nr:DoxX family membrane protein [Chthoniobacterales bacterium]
MRAVVAGEAGGLTTPRAPNRAARISRTALALFFAVAGLNHFLEPKPYLAIVPPSLPGPAALVYISGAAEIAGAVGILFKGTRKLATIGLIALLIAVFPANIYAALHGMQIGGRPIPSALLWARLPLQAVLIAWVYISCWNERKLPK